MLHKDGTVTQLPNDGQDKLAGAEKQVKVSATPPEFPKKNSVVNTSASPKPDKIKDKDKKEKDKKDKSPDAKKKDKPVEDGKRPSIGNPAEQRRSTSPNEKRESQPTANPKKDSTVSSQPKIDPAQHRDEPNKRGSTITGKDHGEPQKQDAQVSPHPEKRESQISGLAKDEHVKRDSSIDGKKPSILSIDIQRNSIGDANNDRRGSYPAPR